MIISIDAEKAFDNIQHHFMTKNTEKARDRSGLFNLIMIMGISEKPTANIIFNGERLKTFPIRLDQDKNAHFHLCNLTLYQKFYPG